MLTAVLVWPAATIGAARGDHLAPAYSYLDGVSCVAANNCTAVGTFYRPPEDLSQALAEHWNGHGWKVEHKVVPGNSGLNGIACPAANRCVAVGVVLDRSVLVVWNGKSWKVDNGPNPNLVSAALQSVSCPSARFCVAVGTRYVTVRGFLQQATLVERWTPGSLKLINAPYARASRSTPADVGFSSGLFGVSCPTDHDCVAVGEKENQYNYESSISESWNGHSWQIMNTPVPSGGAASGLQGVSCHTASFCVADGSYYNSSNDPVTLADIWNGHSWSATAPASPATSTESGDFGVSCWAVGRCTAVGDYYDASEDELTLANGLANGAWTVETPVNPSTELTSALSGVSCRSASACIAVGASYNNADNSNSLAEAWNGTTWRILSTPYPG